MNEKEIFTEEERKAVRDAMREATRKHFSAHVLDLLAGKNYSREETVYQYQEKMGMTSSYNPGIGTGAVSAAVIRDSVINPDRFKFFK